MWIFLLSSIIFSHNEIPFAQVQSLGDRLVREFYGNYNTIQGLSYYGQDEKINAYALIYKDDNGRNVTIVLGARLTCSPVFEIYERMPNYYIKLEEAKLVAENRLNTPLKFEKIYYFGPLEEYFCFNNGKSNFLVNTYSFKIFEKDEFFTRLKPERSEELEKILKEKWNKYLFNPNPFSRDTVIGYVDSVPFIDWVYGCSPTAASMILWYWDPRGYGKLVDYFFTHWDNPEGEWNDCANVNRELALRMYTDTLSGGTYISNIGPGIVNVCNTINGYSFTQQTSGQGTPANQFYFSWIKQEIDAQRPCHWNIMHYQGDPNFNHSVTGVGYAYGSSLPDTFVIVHETWTVSEPWWPLWTYANGYQSYDYVVKVIPGGSNSNNVLLTFPVNVYVVIKGMKYKITWTSAGSDIDHLKIWYSKGRDGYSYDSLYWTLINGYAPNTGSYIWTIPQEDSALRVNIAGLDIWDSRYAADGTFSPFTPIGITDSSNLTLFGHCPISGNTQDVEIIGDYAYIALSEYGIGVISLSDSSLPEVVNTVPIGGSAKTLSYDGQYLYAVTYTDSAFKVISLANPTNPTVIGSVKVSDQTLGFTVNGNTAYIAARMAGLKIVSLANPSNPVEIGSFNTSGQSYDVCLINDTIAVVADGTKDLIFLNVSNPSAPESLLVYNTPGIPKGVWYDGYLFVGDGAMGVGIVDVSNPVQPESLAWFDTPGMAYAGLRKNNLLFVADGPAGLRVLDISNPNNPAEVGWLDSYGNANAVAVQSPIRIVLADGPDGLYIMGSSLGIEELKRGLFTNPILYVFPNPFSDKIYIRYEIPDKSNGGQSVPDVFNLSIYDATGRLVRDFPRSKIDGKILAISWDGTDNEDRPLPAGVYFIQIKDNRGIHGKKVTLLR